MESDAKLVHTRIFQSSVRDLFRGLYPKRDLEDMLMRSIMVDWHSNLAPEYHVESYEDVPEVKVPFVCTAFLLLQPVEATDSVANYFYREMHKLSVKFVEEFSILVMMLKSGGEEARFDDIPVDSRNDFMLATKNYATALAALPFLVNNSFDEFKLSLPLNIVRAQVDIWRDNQASQRRIICLKGYYLLFYGRACDALETARIICDLGDTRI